MTKKKFLNVQPPQTKAKLAKLEHIDTKSKLKDVKVREHPSISLKYFDIGYVSLYDLRDGQNLKLLDSFIKKIQSYDDWDTALKHHHALPTPMDNNHKNLKLRLEGMGIDTKQTDIIHLRLSDKFRVHGFLLDDRFKLVWLDPNHKIHKE